MVPVPPPAAWAALAAATFGPLRDRAEAYAGWLAGPGIDRGLIGPAEAPRLWPRHLLNCALAARWLPADAVVLDVGSGAGLPGIPLALARPDLHVVLLEPLLRRATFLTEVVDALGLSPRVQVRRGRVEELPADVTVDAVTARAVAGLPALLGWAARVVRPAGVVVLLRGAAAATELGAVTDGALRALWTTLSVEHVGDGDPERPASPDGTPVDGPDGAGVTVVRGLRSERPVGRRGGAGRPAGSAPGADPVVGPGPATARGSRAAGTGRTGAAASATGPRTTPGRPGSRATGGSGLPGTAGPAGQGGAPRRSGRPGRRAG